MLITLSEEVKLSLDLIGFSSSLLVAMGVLVAGPDPSVECGENLRRSRFGLREPRMGQPGGLLKWRGRKEEAICPYVSMWR